LRETEDSQDGELGIDDHRLEDSADEEDESGGAGEEEEHQGNSEEGPMMVMESKLTNKGRRKQMRSRRTPLRNPWALLARDLTALT
jgi:hypothetical protein